MSDEQQEELNGLADQAAHYFKALIKRNVPVELAAALVRDWQSANIQDVLDARARGRRDPRASYRMVMTPDVPRTGERE